jgi:hypothetical protein
MHMVGSLADSRGKDLGEGERGVFYLLKLFLPALATPRGKGWGQHTVAMIRMIYCNGHWTMDISLSETVGDTVPLNFRKSVWLCVRGGEGGPAEGTKRRCSRQGGHGSQGIDQE